MAFLAPLAAPMAPNHYGGDESLRGGRRKYFLQHSASASERLQARKGGTRLVSYPGHHL